jgi:hypothetical protein
MPKLVVNLAVLQCSFGLAPSPLTVLPVNRVQAGFQPAGNIMDFKPMVNIVSFGMCSSPSNPTVISATAAAMGVLTPMPCIPNTTAPWVPGAAKTLIANMPALHDGCQCMCMWAGVIKVNVPGQFTVDVA